ncbi:MAG: class I SAM-dependent methyltransferase, partial [Acidobacteriota bacterium]
LRLLHGTLDRRPARILEAGCGTGAFAQKLALEFPCPIHLADLAGEGLRLARGRGLPALVQADIQALPLASDSYDCVLSLDVLIHLAKGRELDAMAELARVLRPGGLLMIRVAALDLLRSRHSAFTYERQRFTRTRLMRTAEQCGLEPLRCTYLNTLLLPVALFRFRVWEPLLRKPASSGVQPVPEWLNGALRRMLKLECAWLARGRNFPAGQSLILFARKRV